MKTQLAQIAELPAPVRIIAFLLVLGVVWLPVALPIALLVRDANQVTIWTMGLLFVEFVLLSRWWGQQVHSDRKIFQTYGLVPSQQNGREFLLGLGLGLLSLLVMFLLQTLLGWQSWQAPAPNFWRIAAEGLLVALGVGLAEELVFRGWILEELQRDYQVAVAAWATSLLFAVLHFLRPLPEMIRTLPQFPGLVLLGLILVWMKQSTRQQYRTAVRLRQDSGRLGWPIGFHAGLVWGYYLLEVGALTQLTGRAPAWVTGIDGNPLAGVVGLLFLSGLALYWRRRLLQRSW